MSRGNKEITRLVLVLGSSVIFAVAITAFFLQYYGPSGRYALSSALLEPKLLQQLNYNDTNAAIGQEDRYVFDHLVYEAGGIKKDVPLDAYRQFFQEIQSDQSPVHGQLQLAQLFAPSPYRALLIYVHTESRSGWQNDKKIFQEVQFSQEGNYYRVLLHEQEPGRNWVYFYHPLITSKTDKLLLSL
jgi:hypothetical protein